MHVTLFLKFSPLTINESPTSVDAVCIRTLAWVHVWREQVHHHPFNCVCDPHQGRISIYWLGQSKHYTKQHWKKLCIRTCMSTSAIGTTHSMTHMTMHWHISCICTWTQSLNSLTIMTEQNIILAIIGCVGLLATLSVYSRASKATLTYERQITRRRLPN